MGLYKIRKELLEELVKEHEVYFCVPDGEYVDLIKNIGNNSNATKAVNAVKTVNTESTGNAGNTDDISNTGCKFIPCNVLERRGTNPFKDLKLISLYWRAISKLKPDVVLTYTIKPNVYGGIVCQTRKVPYIANITGLGTTIENSGLLSFISIILYKFGLRKARCVFFQNRNNEKLFIDKGIANGKTRLIPGSGVDLEVHCSEPYPSDMDGFHFLFVGRIMKDKGINELLEAMRVLHTMKNNVILDIVGFCDEDYAATLNEAERDGVIINHGIQANVHSFYKNCHCVVLPSYHEGMSNVLLEASATGRPIIATRVPGCQETFDEGITGFGCEVRNTESLVESMKKMIALTNTEREQMGLKARIKMEKEYDRNIVIQAYKEEIEEKIGGGI